MARPKTPARISANLRKILLDFRTKKKITQSQLADNAKLTTSAIHSMESGKGGCSLASLAALATALGVKPGKLVELLLA